jgi:hypothetical protein
VCAVPTARAARLIAHPQEPSQFRIGAVTLILVLGLDELFIGADSKCSRRHINTWT